MKTKTTPPKKPVKTIEDYPTFTATKSVTDITNEFVKKESRKDKSGDNSCIADFATLARMVIQNYSAGFSQNDFLSLSRSMDSPPVELARLFHAWIEELQKANLLKSQFSCYSWPVYKFSNQ